MPAATAHHHGMFGHLAGAVAWLRGSTTARHVEAANTALDRVDHTLDRLDQAGHLVSSHLEHHHE